MKKIILIGLMWMIILGVFAAAGCAPKPDGIIAWWQGENNANDIINQNNGALQGDATFAEGKVGKAFNFDGNGDYVQIPHNANLDLSNSYTIEAWVKPSKVTTYQAIVGKGTNPTPPTLYFASNAFRQYYSVDNVPAWQGQVGSVLPGSPQDWYHIAVTYDGSTGVIYINGVLKNTKPLLKPDTNTHDLYLGYDDTLFNNLPGYFNGLIDEVSIYNKALTQQKIQAIIDAGEKGKCVCSPNACVCEDENANKCCKGDGTGYTLSNPCPLKTQCINGDCVGQPAVCGDGKIEGNEVCDDKNEVVNDGCVDCQLESNKWSCSGAPSVCAKQEDQICTDIKALQPTDKTLATTIINALKNNEYDPIQKLNAIVMALKAWLKYMN